MVYSVVPREFEADLFGQLAARYAADPEVTVIVDRRERERRGRRSPSEARQQRELRDRRRRRASGEFAALYGERSLTAGA
jgi:hypothetical protein